MLTVVLLVLFLASAYAAYEFRNNDRPASWWVGAGALGIAFLLAAIGVGAA